KKIAQKYASDASKEAITARLGETALSENAFLEAEEGSMYEAGISD
ncbi:hypothetical protein TNCT_220411, partial [Trichonephila clavata]